MSEWVFKSSPMIFKIRRPSSGFNHCVSFLVMISTVVLFSRLHLYVLSSFSSFAFVSFKSNSLKSSSAALFCNWHHFLPFSPHCTFFLWRYLCREKKNVCLSGFVSHVVIFFVFLLSNLQHFQHHHFSLRSSLFFFLIMSLSLFFCDTQVFVLKDKMTNNNNNDNIFHWHSTPLPSHVTHHPSLCPETEYFDVFYRNKKQKDTEILREESVIPLQTIWINLLNLVTSKILLMMMMIISIGRKEKDKVEKRGHRWEVTEKKKKNMRSYY